MQSAVATLPLYDRVELREATDRLWRFVARALERAGLAAPRALSRPADHAAAWRDDRLLFSQACGYDVRFLFSDRLTPLAAPVYRADGCESGTYRSFLVVRRDEPADGIAALRGKRAAYNEASSHSGRVALAALVAEHAHEGRFFASVTPTGSHERSAEAVARGQADVASLDCTSYALLRRGRPELGGALRVLAETPSCPAPPYVTGPAADPRAFEVLREALERVAHAAELEDVREALLLEGVVPIEASAYERCAELVEVAAHHGYDLLRDTDG